MYRAVSNFDIQEIMKENGSIQYQNSIQLDNWMRLSYANLTLLFQPDVFPPMGGHFRWRRQMGQPPPPPHRSEAPVWTWSWSPCQSSRPWWHLCSVCSSHQSLAESGGMRKQLGLHQCLAQSGEKWRKVAPCGNNWALPEVVKVWYQQDQHRGCTRVGGVGESEDVVSPRRGGLSFDDSDAKSSACYWSWPFVSFLSPTKWQRLFVEKMTCACRFMFSFASKNIQTGVCAFFNFSPCIFGRFCRSAVSCAMFS